MNARDLLIEKLREIGADGLCNGRVECGCDLDDFAPCGDCNIDECEAAKLQSLDGLYFPMKASNSPKERGESSEVQRHAKEGDLARSGAWYGEEGI